MESEQFKKLENKLDKIIKLLAVQTIGNKKGIEAIRLLSDFGFGPKDIADLTGTTPNTVSVTLNTLKKRNKRQ